MEFEWDSSKEKTNHAKHRVKFTYATRVFLDTHRLIIKDTRKDYGETRYNALGMIDNRLFIVSFTMRGRVHRIISARKANKNEQKKYHQIHA